jgi:hypothetical protein
MFAMFDMFADVTNWSHTLRQVTALPSPLLDMIQLCNELSSLNHGIWHVQERSHRLHKLWGRLKTY